MGERMAASQHLTIHSPKEPEHVLVCVICEQNIGSAEHLLQHISQTHGITLWRLSHQEDQAETTQGVTKEEVDEEEEEEEKDGPVSVEQDRFLLFLLLLFIIFLV